jgi:hypothetical protein
VKCSIESVEVQKFTDGFRKIHVDYMDKWYPSLVKSPLLLSDGRRYIKFTGGGFVCVFIDKENGDVLKAASWRVPAKGARGNVFDDYNGLSRVTPYGMEYNN